MSDLRAMGSKDLFIDDSFTLPWWAYQDAWCCCARCGSVVCGDPSVRTHPPSLCAYELEASREFARGLTYVPWTVAELASAGIEHGQATRSDPNHRYLTVFGPPWTYVVAALCCDDGPRGLAWLRYLARDPVAAALVGRNSAASRALLATDPPPCDP